MCPSSLMPLNHLQKCPRSAGFFLIHTWMSKIRTMEVLITRFVSKYRLWIICIFLVMYKNPPHYTRIPFFSFSLLFVDTVMSFLLVHNILNLSNLNLHYFISYVNVLSYLLVSKQLVYEILLLYLIDSPVFFCPCSSNFLL